MLSQDGRSKTYTYSPREKIEDITNIYPEPNVTLHEAEEDDPKAALGVEWTLLKV